MASGRRLRTRKIILSYLYNSGISGSVPASDGSEVTKLSLYASGGSTPVITTGSTVLLSDAVSDQDYVWDLLGYSGETTANASGFLNSSAIRSYIPLAGQADQTISNISSSVLMYSVDGPSAKFNQFYLPTANKIAGTGSMTFTSVISGAAGNLPKLRIYVAGAFPTASTGATISIISGSTTLLTYSSSSLDPAPAATASLDATLSPGISGSGPAAGDKIGIILPINYAYLTTTSSYTIEIITGSLITPPANTMYIVTGAAGINLTGSTLHTIIRQGINGATLSLTSSFGTGFSTLNSYISASSSTSGVSLYATYPGLSGRQIAISGSNNKIKKIAGINYLQFEPYYQSVGFNTASMSTLKIVYSSSAATANLNSFVPGVIVYITGSTF